MLQESQATLYNDVLQDTSRGNIDRATLGGNNDDRSLQGNASAHVHRASDGEMIQLKDPRIGPSHHHWRGERGPRRDSERDGHHRCYRG